MQNTASVSTLNDRLERVVRPLVDDGYELGVQIAVYLRGELIADVCVGRVSSLTDQPVAPDTLFPVCSTGKGVLATLAHIAVDRGEVDYDAPICVYWPEFGANGKQGITLRHALSHQAGANAVPEFASLAEVCDFDAACARMAEMPLAWEPGSAMAYHSRTYGWIVGGALQRAVGQTVGQQLRERIAEPLGIEGEMFFGISEEADKRFSPFEPQPTQAEQKTTDPSTHAPQPAQRASELTLPLNDFVNLPQVRRSCMPAVNGIMSARAIARHYAALVGEVDGVRLLSPERLALATTRQTRLGETPECFGHGFGLGYALKGPDDDNGAFFGHGGAGGSEGMANRPLQLGIGFAKNRMDTHADAPNHTNWLVFCEIMATVGHEGGGG